MTGIRIHPLRDVSISPSLGDLVGTSSSQQLMDAMNMDASGGIGSVIFGANDPIPQFQALRGTILENIKQTSDLIRQTISSVSNIAQIVPIVEKEQLEYVPKSMWEPILCYAPVRKLLKEERIFGFGVEPDWLPAADTWGRLIANGTVDTQAQKKVPEMMNWEFDSEDPDWTFEDIDAVQETREFIDSFLEEELAKSRGKDLTDYPRYMTKK